MSFTLSVRMPYNERCIPDDPSEIDAWMEERERSELYEFPIASDNDFFRYWHKPAIEMNLSYVGRIYDHGLTLKKSKEKQEFLEELNALRDFWKKNDVDYFIKVGDRLNSIVKAVEESLNQNNWLVI